MDVDLISRYLLAVGLLVTSCAWAWALLGRAKPQRITQARQQRFERFMIVAVGLLVVGTILGLITSDSDRWNAGSIMLAIFALSGWAQERQYRSTTRNGMSTRAERQ